MFVQKGPQNLVNKSFCVHRLLLLLLLLLVKVHVQLERGKKKQLKIIKKEFPCRESNPGSVGSWLQIM